MTWTCPNCKRIFKHKNQWHSCVRVDAEDHFSGKGPNVKEIYDKLLKEVKKFGEVNISPVKGCILLKASGTFLALKPKKEWMDIEFLLSEKVDDFLIHKTVRVSNHRFAHFVRLEDPKQVTKQLLGWLNRSYKLISNK